jgi:hypothetical protein
MSTYTYLTDLPTQRYTLTYTTRYGVARCEYLPDGEYALHYAKWLYTSSTAWCVALHDTQDNGRCIYHRADSVYGLPTTQG